ncbi:outer membrane beta-barrel protein [Cognatiyoonia sp. IB215446]|uniref:outer membrane protein n=1 Tax=Cognatiyoonia sp. IB215446 TaxID=3097355 RepID=UPI002A14DCBD|nr:outer membrane beta-barrel protein [Cognatiyoonia sp. IB215446]MDX8348765.1 outer membrane beta-barrel protein [Cognatiyoonia sp. IB215446]
MKPTFKAVRASMLAAPLAIVAGMASAGGLSEPVATPAPVPVAPVPVAPVGTDWTGFYAGAQLGFGELEAELGGTDALDGDESGLLFGAHAGYLYDFGNIVLGGELDIDGSNIEPELAIADDTFELDTVTRAKLLLGYDAGRFLPYLTGGVAQARTSSSTDAVDGDDDGTFAGLGVKYLLSDSFMIGGEVLQHQFDDYITDDLDVEALTGTLRASFRF